MKFACLVKDQPHYRRDAVVEGLRALGGVVAGADQLGRGDVIVIWNRYGEPAAMADRAQKRGAAVVVMENGYLGADAQGHQLYAMALHGHNGSGAWHAPADGDLRRARGCAFADQVQHALYQAPQRDGYVLVCGQRGIGTPLMASPPDWHHRMAERLAGWTRRPIKIRAHPGRHEPEVPLEQDLAGAAFVVVWSSSIAGKAMLAGIRALYDAPYHVLAATTSAVAIGRADEQNVRRLDADTNADPVPWTSHGYKERAFILASWAQWTVAEIAAGAAFRMLLEPPADAVRCGPWDPATGKLREARR